jgi:hypothetical protein
VTILNHSHKRLFGVAWCTCGCGVVAVCFWRWEFVWNLKLEE